MVEAGTIDVGRIEQRVAASIEDFETATFLFSHLKEAVAAADREVVELQFSGDLKPVVIPGDRIQQVVLPRRPEV